VLDFPVIAEIQAEALRANVRAIRRRLPPGQPVCAAVKANAYGHGVELVLPILADEGVEQIAVANLPEAIQSRELGWNRPVLCLGALLAAETHCERTNRARAVLAMGFSCTLTTFAEAQMLSAEAVRAGQIARVQIKVDTGMGRSGVRIDNAEELISAIGDLPRTCIDGVYTHFATADEQETALAREQIGRFLDLRDRLRRRGVAVRAYHAANSAAVFRLPEAHLDLARPGLAVYGYWGGPDGERPADLVPAMRVVARLTAVRHLPPGHAVGYGCTYHTSRESVIGVVPIGYADGYRRTLSNAAMMTLMATRGQPRRNVPVIGRVSMDQTTVDLTDAGDVQVGDAIVIIDNDPAAVNSVEAMARRLDTIPYEITCLLGQRVRRILR